MERYVHADKVIAKSENMDLVVIVNHGDKSNPNWVVTSDKGSVNFPIWHKDSDYFLCYEKHKEVCLEFLNGGEVEVYHYDGWLTASHVKTRWTHESIFMHSETLIRIKPLTEKKWIAISLSRGVSNTLYDTLSHAEEGVPSADQYIEIEVEVK